MFAEGVTFAFAGGVTFVFAEGVTFAFAGGTPVSCRGLEDLPTFQFYRPTDERLPPPQEVPTAASATSGRIDPVVSLFSLRVSCGSYGRLTCFHRRAKVPGAPTLRLRWIGPVPRVQQRCASVERGGCMPQVDRLYTPSAPTPCTSMCVAAPRTVLSMSQGSLAVRLRRARGAYAGTGN